MDHREWLWNGDPSILDAKRVLDKSVQIEEYEILQWIPQIHWLGDWEFVVGVEVFAELGAIADSKRRESLLEYAQQIDDLRHMGLRSDLEMDEENPSVTNFETGWGFFQSDFKQAMDGLPSSDKPLVSEALRMNCAVMLTTDHNLLIKGLILQNWVSLKIIKPSDWVYDVVASGGILDIGHPDSTFGDIFPDILLYTGLIPERYE